MGLLLGNTKLAEQRIHSGHIHKLVHAITADRKDPFSPRSARFPRHPADCRSFLNSLPVPSRALFLHAKIFPDEMESHFAGGVKGGFLVVRFINEVCG